MGADQLSAPDRRIAKTPTSLGFGVGHGVGIRTCHRVGHRRFVRTIEDRAVAVGHSLELKRWRVILDEAVTRVADRFVRAEPRRIAGQFMEGLLSDADRKTCWSLAERAGHVDPQATQRLLRTAIWPRPVSPCRPSGNR